MTTDIENGLKKLHLPAILASYQEEAGQARRECLSFEQYLLELVERECEARHCNRIARLLRESRLPLEKSLQNFERKRLPARVNACLSVLADGSFLKRTENVLAFGNPGSGKTHLLCAIGQELVHQGHRIFFTSCSTLVQKLPVAKRDLKLPAILKKYGRYEALIIDDIGYVQHSREEMEVLFTLLADRYERSSIMLTSNLPFSKWESIFKDPMTTAAAIDRLVHHSIILELNLSSYRLEHSKQQNTGSDEQEAVTSPPAPGELRSPYGLPPFLPARAAWNPLSLTTKKKMEEDACISKILQKEFSLILKM
ncbi:MAG: ATP-binding protein [Gammaproteobacteria bacterium]|nr:ATP-binding protein [Gammaproteobacteria bacterium]